MLNKLLDSLANQRNIFFVLVLFSLVSCRKDVDEFIPVDIVIPGNVARLFQETGASAQVFVIDESLLSFTTAGNAVLTFQAHGFIFEDTGEKVSGAIEVSITELFDAGDFVSNEIPTESANEVLNAIASVRVLLSQDGRIIQLDSGNSFTIQISSTDVKDEVELFLENGDAPVFQWKEADNDILLTDNVSQAQWWVNDPSPGFLDAGYESTVTNTGWISLASKSDFGGVMLTKVCADLEEAFDGVNSAAFLVFADQNSVVRMYQDPEEDMFCAAKMPIDSEVTLVLLSEQGGDGYFLGNSTFSIQPNHVESIFPQGITIGEILSYLTQL